MGRKATDVERAAYADREHTLYRMFSQGERDPQYVLDGIQNLIEGKAAIQTVLKIQSREELLTPVDQLIERFMARSKLRGWGFSGNYAEEIRNTLNRHPHASTLKPTAVSCWLGKNLAYNWAEALAWVLDTAREVGLEPTNYLADAKPEFYAGSEIRGRNKKLAVVGLDFETFFDPKDGVVPDHIRPTRVCWPSLEVLYFLALNPGYLKAMDGNKLPWLMAPGLVVDGGLVPGFDRGGQRFFAYHGWADDRWSNAAMVAFGEL